VRIPIHTIASKALLCRKKDCRSLGVAGVVDFQSLADKFLCAGRICVRSQCPSRSLFSNFPPRWSSPGLPTDLLTAAPIVGRRASRSVADGITAISCISSDSFRFAIPNSWMVLPANRALCSLVPLKAQATTILPSREIIELSDHAMNLREPPVPNRKRHRSISWSRLETAFC
jgi:hypothetical protein